MFAPYRAAGNPAAPHHGDYFAGKGIGYARMAVHNHTVHVFNTHTCANYAHNYRQEAGWQVPTDADAPIRLAQLLQLVSFIQLTAGQAGQHIVVGGDLNAMPDQLEIVAFKALLPDLRDVWATVSSEDGFTSNSPMNSLSKTSGDAPVRIDYIWTSGQPVGASLFERRCADGRTSVTDHEGVEATIMLSRSEPPASGACHSEEPVKAAIASILQGAQRYQWWRVALVVLAAACAVASLVTFGFTVASPWWRGYPKPLVPVLSALQLGTAVLAPLLFIIGMAGFGSVSYALQQAADELGLFLRHGVQSTTS